MVKKNILICSYCLNRNYNISTHKKNHRLNLKKYCSKCKKHILHEESK
ncbi:ribosomal protein L33 [Candidatus Phytoplasma oryzae]|uniref:Large ribosomal subunit protein bL33 n=1 Tax=Candidatus Phytoplasma oryzae TaxID=203274 RepID=A0A139JPZ5_9MOLU|nr:50S ribosomal protein L33 [Candidatus Phytoplasma oryzae]KXT29045.1 ribosomal protein L33 [Candidatus Phytoplasma oryzae]RAM57805.1 50S ribosomal protein L33 [Candidatus Phytoplasma oryzae]